MRKPVSRYLPAQVLFGAVFLLSVSFLLFTRVNLEGQPPAPAAATSTRVALSSATPPAARTPTGIRTPTPTPRPPSVDSTNYLLTVILPLLSSILSAFGFISTTVMAWRKEKRDEGLAQLELERQKIELEKAKLELEQQKWEQQKQSGKEDKSD